MIFLFKNMTKINLKDLIKKIKNKPWSPIDVARVNDQVTRIAYFKGDYHWHKHKNKDELFFVYQGNIVIQFKDRDDLILNQGELYIVPKAVFHCPKSEQGAYVLMFEPFVLESKGD
jgi:mannose-6-phosphate isomerase-like protein (cupin superfamily)